MSFQNPANTTPRRNWQIFGGMDPRTHEMMMPMQHMWTKMWDPPTESPDTPELVVATNPVPEYMAQGGFANQPKTPHTVQRDLLHGTDLTMWDGKQVRFYTFRDSDNPTTGPGNFPGATIRIPRGKIFHGATSGHGPPPHTIHWHGIEPTPMNDGVGHCSMEIGSYTYQWQPNFMGSYFYHCHRNTVQHFEFGLYGFMIIEAPDFNPLDPTTFRVACNLPNYPGFVGGDPVYGVANADDTGAGDPHAFTIPYDVEALWVLDDVDSVWRERAFNARAFYPAHKNSPGVDDFFPHGFFNDFNPDYWFVTGVGVPAKKGRIGTLPTGVDIPPALNSGVTGTQVDVRAQVGQTVLIRCLDAAYNSAHITFPVDVDIIAFDGRALGVPPFGRYSNSFRLKAGRVFQLSTARRFDCVFRATQPINSHAVVKFIATTNQIPGEREAVLLTARIPFVIT